MSVKPFTLKTLLSAAFVVTLCSAVSAEMIILSSARSISTSGSQREPIVTSTEDELPFVDDILDGGYIRDDSDAIVGTVSISASQTSMVTTSRIRGVGRGSGFASGPAESSGRSDMMVDFLIEESTRFTLAGELRLTPHGLGLNGSSAFIRLTGPDGVAAEIRLDEESLPDRAGVVDFLGSNRIVGELGPGRYTLEASSVGHGSSGLTRCADFDFTLTATDGVVIPEPGSVCLLLIGCSLLFVGRHRRKSTVPTL